MSSLTDVAHDPLFRNAKRVSRRAHIAPYVSAGFAGLAAAVLLLFAYQAGFFDQFAPQAPKPPISKPAEQVTVSQSTITGFDKNNRPYALTAQSAVQDKDVPNKVHLETVSGESQRSNGEAMKMRADTGLYDTSTKNLVLKGAVEIASQGRFTAHMDTAHVAVKENKLVSYSPVTVDLSGGGTIKAQALQITNDGDNILFFDGVRAEFKSQASKGDGSP
jgi:lipopolysaccharide export system protein LptC